MIRSTDVQKPARPAAHLLMTMLTTAILMVHGSERMIRSISARKPVLSVVIPAKNMQTTEIPKQMVSATIAVLLSA